MLDCVSVDNMRLSDQQTIATMTSSLVLMYRTAYGVFRAADWLGKTAIVVGSGNNGGDGFALADILQQHGLPCHVFTLSSKLSSDSSYYAQKARQAGVAISDYVPGCLQGYETIVDCMLGTGFQGAVRDQYRAAIEEINESNAYVISVDINSGMHGDIGSAPLAVISDLTVTIGYVKKGLISPEAGRFMKRLVCVDIGIRLAYEEEKICDELEWRTLCLKHCLKIEQSHVTVDEVVYHRCPSWLDCRIILSKDIN